MGTRDPETTEMVPSRCTESVASLPVTKVGDSKGSCLGTEAWGRSPDPVQGVQGTFGVLSGH